MVGKIWKRLTSTGLYFAFTLLHLPGHCCRYWGLFILVLFLTKWSNKRMIWLLNIESIHCVQLLVNSLCLIFHRDEYQFVRGEASSIHFDLGLSAPYLDLPFLRSGIPSKSLTPRIQWNFTPGKSFTLPPLTKTIECSCKLWPSPGM